MRAFHLAAAVASLGVLVSSSLAEAALPSYLGAGFPLETLDPAPPGGPFLTVPTPPSANEVGTRLLGDYASNPVRFQLPTGAGVSSASYVSYAHAGLSVAFLNAFQLAVNIPIVFRQNVSTSDVQAGLAQAEVAPNPEAGDLGDVKLSLAVYGPWDSHCPCSKVLRHFGVLADLWAGTGDAQTLTGEPGWRGRVSAVWSDRFSIWGPWALQTGATVGYQSLFSTAPPLGLARSIPTRLGLSAIFSPPESRCLSSVRANAEWQGTLFNEGSGVSSRHLQEFLLGPSVEFKNGVSVVADLGLGASDAPGVPEWRFVGGIQYRSPLRRPAPP